MAYPAWAMMENTPGRPWPAIEVGDDRGRNVLSSTSPTTSIRRPSTICRLAIPHPACFTTACARRWGTPPQAMKWGAIPIAWKHGLHLEWGVCHLETQFFLTSSVASQVLWQPPRQYYQSYYAPHGSPATRPLAGLHGRSITSCEVHARDTHDRKGGIGAAEDCRLGHRVRPCYYTFLARRDVQSCASCSRRGP